MDNNFDVTELQGLMINLSLSESLIPTEIINLMGNLTIKDWDEDNCIAQITAYELRVILRKIKLSKLKKTKQLIKTLESLDITEKDFLDSGCTATVFIKNGQAVKVCGKTIRYFSSYDGNAQSFKKHINSLSHIFLPVKNILYEDSNCFIYTQDLCKPLNKN